MKKTKKIVSVILALMLVLGMTTTVFAAGNDGKITINNAVKGQKYSVYQILDLESYNEASGAYAYKANDKWVDWLKAQTSYVRVDEQNYVTWVADTKDEIVASFAKAAKAYAKEKVITPDQTIEANGTTIEFTGLDLGWYLVDTTLGTICSLDTTDNTVVMEEKNEAPSITKEVQEDSNNGWGASNDADINQVVNFKATITVQKGAENYVMHDTMSEGLTYIGVTSVKVNGTDVDTEKYAVTEDSADDDACTFEVAFDNAYIAGLPVGTQIVVEYSAKLNENAVVALPGNPNTVKLQYGDENHPSYTPEKTTITYTWDAAVFKFTGEDKTPLANAVFKLSLDADGVNVFKFHELSATEYQVCAQEDCTAAHETEITTTESGRFNIVGLDADTYYLTETQAPAGYNKLPAPVQVTVTGAAQDGTYTTFIAEVENNTGSLMPDTGGMGTTILYIIGAILVIGAGVTLVTRRRVNS